MADDLRVWNIFLSGRLSVRSSPAQLVLLCTTDSTSTIITPLPEERLLEWCVEDGWEPLCRFLGKEVPDVELPSGNPPKAWAERIARTMEVHHKHTVRNMMLFIAVVGVVLGFWGLGLFY
ncbi:hypothetical protein AFGD_003870 [Aspergillus flavus]|nr:hypothetical protein AFGD_003870 [Aspergillus flavus]